jgi:hypothetical protein
VEGGGGAAATIEDQVAHHSPSHTPRLFSHFEQRGGRGHVDVGLFTVARNTVESLLDFCVAVDAHIPIDDSTCRAKSRGGFGSWRGVHQALLSLMR